LRFSEKEQFVETISSLMIPTQTGNVPLLSLGALLILHR